MVGVETSGFTLAFVVALDVLRTRDSSRRHKLEPDVGPSVSASESKDGSNLPMACAAVSVTILKNRPAERGGGARRLRMVSWSVRRWSGERRSLERIGMTKDGRRAKERRRTQYVKRTREVEDQ